MKREINDKSFLFTRGNQKDGWKRTFFFCRKKGSLESFQIETFVKVIKDELKKWMVRMKRKNLAILVYPDIPRTEKPLCSRMGKGKGVSENWLRLVTAGSVLFYIRGIYPAVAKAILKRLKTKTKLNFNYTYR